MSRLTIVEGNSNDKDNVRALLVKGEQGLSAYEVYVKNGGTLTEEQWLDEFLNADNFYNKSEVENYVAGQLHNGTGGSFYKGREKAIVFNRGTSPSSTAFVPVSACKTKDGVWSIGTVVGPASTTEKLHFVYNTDDNYEGDINYTQRITLPTLRGSNNANGTAFIEVGKVLYDNLSGDNGTINLTDNSANYDFFDIIYFHHRDNKDWYSCIRVFDPNGKYFSLSGIIGDANDSNNVKGGYGTGTISGTSITRGANGNGAFEWVGIHPDSTATGTISSNTNNNFKIVKVIGYTY